MSDRVQQVFELIDKVTGPLSKISEKIEHVSERMSEMVAQFVGFEGITSIHEQIGELNETYKIIGTMRSALGTTTDQASNLLQVFDKVAVGPQEVLSILTRMERKEDQVEEGASRIKEVYKKMGISDKDSPEQKLIKMSEAAKKTGITLRQVQEVTGATGDKANAIMKLLQKGPEVLKKQFEEAGDEAEHINAQMLMNYGIMRAAKNEAGDAFKGAVNVIYSTLLPAMTTIFERIQKSIEQWTPTVKRFAQYLSDHMDHVLGVAKNIARYLMVSNMVSRLSGGASVVGLAGKALEGGFGKEGLGSVGGILGPIFKLFGKFPGPMMAIALAVGIVISHWDKFKPILSTLYENFSRLIGQVLVFLKPLFDLLDKLGSSVLQMAFQALSYALETIIKVVNNIIWIVRLLGNVMADVMEHPTHLFHIGRTFEEQAAIMQAEDAAGALAAVQAAFVRGFSAEQARQAVALGDKLMAEAAKKGGLHQDFRGSKFDITQNFDKDFDPDRVATAMANEFGKIGERSLQSGLAPLFGVR